MQEGKYKKYIEEQLPAALTVFEKQLIKNQGGDGWFVGNKVSPDFTTLLLADKENNINKHFNIANIATIGV